MADEKTDREKYLDGEIAHADYYRMIYREAGITMKNSGILDECREALARGDEHLNDIPLQKWDMMAASYINQEKLRQVFENHGDGCSMAGGVCIYKQAVRDAIDGVQS